jgi:hypothetical protein
MTIAQMQMRLVRIMQDMDAVAQELHTRRLADDWLRIEDSRIAVGTVCDAFLDDGDQRTRLLDSSDMERPEPLAVKPFPMRVKAAKRMAKAA